jgi:hypothetical protein
METSSWVLMLVQTSAFIGAWALIHGFVAKHGPISQVRAWVKFNSWFYAALSFIMFGLILVPSYESTARTLYHYSKFYEYVDILGVRAIGGPIDLHFGFHHLTTPYFTFIRVINHSEGWWLFAALNTFHHALMYAYFGGAGRLRPLLLVTCGIQYVVGMAAEAFIVLQKQQRDEVIWPNIFTLCLLFAYSTLWIRDLRLQSKKQGKVD